MNALCGRFSKLFSWPLAEREQRAERATLIITFKVSVGSRAIREQQDYQVSPVPQLSRQLLERLWIWKKHTWLCFCTVVVILSRGGQIRKKWNVRTWAGTTDQPVQPSWAQKHCAGGFEEMSVYVVTHCGNTNNIVITAIDTCWYLSGWLFSSFGSNISQTC